MSAPHSEVQSLIGLVVSYWWVLWGLLCLGASAVRACMAGAHRWSKVRHKRRLELIKAQARLQAATAASQYTSLPGRPLPGPCAHRRVRQVRDRDDKLVAWLCECDTQLPQDWAVATEDLP